MASETQQLPPGRPTPKVSVLMITYNHEKFIAQAIESVLMQETTFPIELVIGEDCSTDKTRKIVKEFVARCPNVIRAIFHEKNIGGARNSEAVLNSCRGQYIACLEGDDYWTDPYKLRKQVELMETHPECSLCGAATRIVEDRGSGMYEQVGIIEPVVKKKLYTLTDFLEYYPFHTSTLVIRRGLVTLPEWFSQVTNGDVVFYALHSEKGPCIYLDEVTSVYRRHAGGSWVGRSAVAQCEELKKTLVALSARYGGRYDNILRRREALSGLVLASQAGYQYEAKMLFRTYALRLLTLRPLAVAGLGIRIYGHWVFEGWRRLRMDLGFGVRLRRLGRSLFGARNRP